MKLRKVLGLTDIYCMATGAMISSGIFVLPGLAHAKAGPSMIFSYLLAGALASIGMLCAAELVTAMPKAGGDYFFISRSLGPAAGSVAGLLNWFSLSLKSAFALVGMAAVIRFFVDVDIRLAGVLLCAGFVALNLLGTHYAGRLQVALVVGLLLIMGAYIIKGMPHVNPTYLTPFAPHGLDATLATAGFVFVSYGGLIKLSSVAEEVRNPSRTLPYGMLASLVSVAALYTLMVFVTAGVLPGGSLNNSLTPITDGARMFMGPWGTRAVGMAAVLAFVTTANAGILAASRYLYALSADDLLPKRLQELTRRSAVPYVAVLATGLFICGSLFLKLDVLVEAASLVLILNFMLSCVCVVVLRESRVQNYRPSFRAPFYPLLQIVGLLGFTLLVFELGHEAYAICAVLFLISMASYWVYGRKRERKDYALLHLVERLTARELVTGALENELKEIVRERDEIITDRFDELVSRSLVLDLSGVTDARACFLQLADTLAERLDMPPDELERLFIAREEETSTVLTPFLAIPHIVIPGDGKVQLVLVRAKAGVRFSDEAPAVHALFVLIGTRDERNFHLRALASIAQIVQEKEFESRWLRARREAGIRDVVLMGKRVRKPAPFDG